MIGQKIKALLMASRALVVVACFLFLWEFASYIFNPPEYLLPRPSQVILELFSKPEIYISNGFKTLMNTLAAFAMSTVIGIVIAVAIVHSKFLENTLYTLLVAFNNIPKVALAPLFVLWFGTGNASKIAVAFFIAIFAMVVSTVLGLRSVQPEMLDLAHDVVPEISDNAAVERWQVGDARRAMESEQRLECSERAGVARHRVGKWAFDLDVAAAHDQRALGITPEERESSPTLRVLDRLQEESRRAVGLGADELDERRHGGLEVGQHLAPHRHHRVIAGQRPEVVTRWSDGSGRAHRASGDCESGDGVAPPPNARKKHDRSPVWQAPRPSCSTTKRSVSPSQS